MGAFASLSRPRCPPTRSLSARAKPGQFPSLGELNGGRHGFLVPGGEAARAGGQRQGQPLGEPGAGGRHKQPRRPPAPPPTVTSRDGHGPAQRPGAGGQGPFEPPSRLSQSHVLQTHTRSWAAQRHRTREGSPAWGASLAEREEGGPLSPHGSQPEHSGGHPDLGLQRSVRKINQ